MRWWNKVLGSSGAFTILFASLLHLAWAGLLFYDISVENVTSIKGLDFLVPGEHNRRYLLSFVALLALGGLFFFKSLVWKTISLLPQQLVLFGSSMGALDAILRGSYADGVPRPSAFIAADQMWTFVLGFIYTLAVINQARELHPVLQREKVLLEQSKTG